MKADAERSVLFVNRVHPPAPGATGELLQQLAATLAASGWRVTVVAARPAGVRARGETRDGVRFEWVGGLPFTRASHARRALSYLSLYPALLGRLWRLPRHGTVVLLTDPLLQFVLGLLVRPFKRCQLVHWAQDVYPEVAEELGVIRKGGALAGLLRGGANFALRRFDRVIAVGACMKQRLVARGLAAEKITVIPNWADPQEVRPVARAANAFLKEQGMTERFVVMYSGNFGLAHQFEPILDSAELLAAREPRVVFLLVGDGPRAAWIQAGVARRNLANVRVLPPTPRARLAESLGAADLHLVSMRAELCGLVVPSKVYGVLAAGRPVIFLGPDASEVAQVIAKNACGTVLPGADGAALAREIERWLADAPGREAAGQRGRAAVESEDVRAVAERFAAALAGHRG